jgi:hypothetical protein
MGVERAAERAATLRRVSALEPSRGTVVGPSAAPQLLGGLLSVAVWLRRTILKLAAVGAVAAALIGYALVRHGFPDEPGPALGTALGLALVAAPPLVLGTFWFLLGELVRLPDRIRRMPMDTRQHGEDLRRLVDDARARRGIRFVPGQVWRLGRLTASSRELLTPYAPLLPLFNVPFLAAVVASAFAVFVTSAIAVIVAIALLV